MGEHARANKMSITMPADVAAEIRARAGHGRVSAYVTNALLRQLEHDRLGDLVAELEEVHDLATIEELTAARAEWSDS